jgi:hypothetical protein
MRGVGFEYTTPVFERAETVHAATVIGQLDVQTSKFSDLGLHKPACSSGRPSEWERSIETKS